MEARAIPADNYDAEIVSITETVSTAYDNKNQYAVEFRIIDPDEPMDGVKIRKWVNRQLVVSEENEDQLEEKISQQSKLYELLTAADPTGDFAIGTQLDVVEFLKGKKVRINVTVAKGADGKDRSKVSSVLPYKRKKVAA